MPYTGNDPDKQHGAHPNAECCDAATTGGNGFVQCKLAFGIPGWETPVRVFWLADSACAFYNRREYNVRRIGQFKY